MLPGAGALASYVVWALLTKFSQLLVSDLPTAFGARARFVVSGACNRALAPEAGALPELSWNKARTHRWRSSPA